MSVRFTMFRARISSRLLITANNLSVKEHLLRAGSRLYGCSAKEIVVFGRIRSAGRRVRSAFYF